MHRFLRPCVALVCINWLLFSASQQVETPANQVETSNQAQKPVRVNATTGRNLIPPGYVFQPNIPHDLVTENLGAIGNQPFVDNLAWQSFIALNWPVPEHITQRGVPDRQNLIGGFVDTGEGGKKVSPTGPTVWETFKNAFDIYLNPPTQPTSFDTPPIVPAECGNMAGVNVLYEYLQAFTGAPLIDQNGEKVWYQVNLNRVYFDYVVDHKYYDSRNQKGAKIEFPESSNTTANPATVRIKAAWKVMGGPNSKQPDNKSRFYTSQAILYDPVTKTCRSELMGLVGLHIVIKTELLPQWMWATFEQVDNAPDQDSGPQQGVTYNFYDPNCKDCPVNTPPAPDSTTPTQVMRVVPVSSFAPNQVFQEALKSLRKDNVWQYYELVDAQWGASAEPLGVPNQPKYLANTTMETYLQEPVDDPSAPHGCINCHGTYAGDTDLDFQLKRAYPHEKTFAQRFLVSRTSLKPEDR